MKDGIYTIDFAAQGGTGAGMLVFEGGRIFGVDAGRAKYDGSYEINTTTGMADVIRLDH
jgi:T3SS negative regulator,GrlR